MAWEKAAEETKAMKAAGRAAANPKTTKDEPTKERKIALGKEAAKRQPAAKLAAEKAANLAASLTDAEAAEAAPKKAAADKAADKATRGASSQFYKSRDALRCWVPLTSDAGLPIAKSMWDMMMPNSLAVFRLPKMLQMRSSPPRRGWLTEIQCSQVVEIS